MLPGMQLDPDALSRLRHALRERGQPSLVPPPPAASPGPDTASPEALAAEARVAPICELLSLMMTADGSATGPEREVLRGAVRALTDGALRSADIERMLAGFDERRAREGRAARLEHVAAQLAADRSDA